MNGSPFLNKPRTFIVLGWKNQFKSMLLLAVLVSLLAACQAQGLSRILPGKNVTQEIHFNMPDANEVYLVWGINGWKTLAASDWPKGTYVRDSLMYTPMTRSGDGYSVSLQVPDQAVIDFGFLASVDKSGSPAQVWVADGEQDFHVTAEKDGVFTYQQQGSVGAETQENQTDQSQLAKWVINYSLPGAKEVSLVWGIGGWKVLPEQLQPDGTIIQNGFMMTPMVKTGKVFTIALSVPRNVELDYRFLISNSQNGGQVATWDPSEGDGYHNQVQKDGSTMIESWLQLNPAKDSTRIMAAGLYLLVGLVLVIIVGLIFSR